MAEKKLNSTRTTLPKEAATSTPLDPEGLAEFKRSFREIRREAAKPNSTSIEESISKAIEFSTRHQIVGGEALLVATKLESQQKYAEAASVLNEASNAILPMLEGYRLSLLGAIARKEKRFDDAIKLFEQALVTPGYDKVGTAWHNIGFIFAIKEEHGRAIDAYQSALATSDTAALGDIWHNIGVAYSAKGEFDRAVEAYRKALATADYDTPNLTRTNLASALYRAGKPQDALNEIRKVLSEPDVEKQHSRARVIKKLVENALSSDALQPADRRQVAPESPTTPVDNRPSIEARMLAKVQNAKESQYDKYVKQLNSTRDNELSILRGWSSSVTLLDGSRGRWRGGGYFLKWRGKGIVIDPGLDFLHNFHDAEFHGREIDAVIVSHNHPDHNAEIKHLDDLRYEIWTALTRAGKDTPPPYVPVLDFDTRDQRKEDFRNAGIVHRYQPISLDLGRCRPVDTLDESKLYGLPCSITYFQAQHGNDVPNATSCIVTLHADSEPDFKIGYTADTAYYPELKDRLAGCDVLLAHISQPDFEEYEDPSHRKKVHLGYRGLIQLLKDMDPKPPLTLVGEFWAGLTDLRIDLCKGVSEQSGVKHVLPTSIGMHIHLPSREIECTECKTRTSFDKIKVAPPADIYGSLSYLCPNCLL